MNKKILLIITGSIACYKSVEIIRLLRKNNNDVNVILTKAAAQFITPLLTSSVSGKETFTDLFSLKNEVEMGHIKLSRSADLILVAPASADIIAKFANGIADDLASCSLLAAKCPIYFAPAMNVEMWNNIATQENVKTLKNRSINFIGPDSGEMACGEYGFGKLIDPQEIINIIG